MAVEQKYRKVIIAGGGTGGHIFPGLAIAGALKKLDPSVQILFVGARGKMEMQRVPEAGYEIRGIDIAGYNRSSILKNISLPYKLVKSYFQVKQILKDFSPDVVVGVGGYSSYPVLRIAQANKIPTCIHESNSLPGRSNLAPGKKAVKVFVATDNMEKYFPPSKIIVSGNPIRTEILQKSPRGEALQFFGLKPEFKTVLVVGGSLGAKSINEEISSKIDVFKKKQVQLIWQTGKNFSGDAARQEEEFSNIWTNAFISRMDLAYGAADVVVARAGAMTIAELKARAKASILVPYPFAAEDHQTVNAKDLADKQAALMIPDKEVGEKLFPAIMDLLDDVEKVQSLEQNIAREAITNADTIIAEEILKMMKD